MKRITVFAVQTISQAALLGQTLANIKLNLFMAANVGLMGQ
jgi:hypothetical protein